MAILTVGAEETRRQYPRVPISLIPRKLVIDLPDWVQTYFARTFPQAFPLIEASSPQGDAGDHYDSSSSCSMSVIASPAQGGESYVSRIDNLSLGGCLIEGPVPLPRGTLVSLEIPLAFSTISVITEATQRQPVLVSSTDSVLLSSMLPGETDIDERGGVLYSRASAATVSITVWGQTVRTAQKKAAPAQDANSVPIYTSGCRFTQMTDDDHKLLALFLRQRTERLASASSTQMFGQPTFTARS